MKKAITLTFLALLVVSFSFTPKTVYAAAVDGVNAVKQRGIIPGYGVDLSRWKYKDVSDSAAYSEDAIVYAPDVGASASGVNSYIYSYGERTTYSIYFEDGKAHSGIISYTSSSNILWKCNDSNVGISGGLNGHFYVSDVTGFQIYYDTYTVSSTAPTLDDNYNITITGFTEVDSGTDISDLYDLINTNFSTTTSGTFAYYVRQLYTRNHNDLVNVKNAVTDAINSLFTAGEEKPLDVIITDLNIIYAKESEIYTKLSDLYDETYDQGLTLDSLLSETVDQGLTLDHISSVLDDIYTYLQEFKQYDIPVESFFINWSLIRNTIQSNYVSIGNRQYWQKYPIFSLNANDNFGTFFNAGQEKTIILGVDKNISNSSAFLNYFSVTSGIDIINFYNYGNSFPQFRFIRVTLKNNTSAGISCYFTALSSFKVIGIYLSSNIGLSQSFMENWFNPDIQSVVDTNDDKTDEFSDQAADLFDQEDSALDDFESSLDALPESTITGLTGLVSGASWVRDRFNDLTVNNVYGQFITYSLTIGIALLMIGKLR